MMAQTEMKTETSINSFAEEGGDDIFHSWTFGIYMGISADLNTFSWTLNPFICITFRDLLKMVML